MKFQLRSYQSESVKYLRAAIKGGANKPILGLPTGAGKTVTFSHLADLALKRGSRVAVVCHRKELIEQAKDTMEAYGLPVNKIHFGMVQKFVRSPHKIPPMDLCIIDECHIGNFRRFIDLLPESVQVIGATATPISASKKQPLNKTFNGVVYPVQIADLIKQGFLSKPIYHVWKINESQLEKDFKGEFTESSQARVFSMGDLLEAVNRRHGKTIIFTSSIKQTEQVFEAIDYTKKFYVHSKMKPSERERIVKQYKATTDSVMINCGILTAGFDDPTIETVIVYRATTSLSLWLQMCGRGSRVTNTKDTFYIYDMGNNLKRLLAWEVSRDWKSIFSLQGKKLKDGEAPMKNCVSCEAIIYASQTVCPYCQETQPTKAKEELKATEVQIISSFHDLPEHLQKPYKEMSVNELIERAAHGSGGLGRPFKSSWIVNQIKQRDNKKELLTEYARIKGYKFGWVLRQL
jgi:superfamily II DNA or RNA helicase